MPRDPPLRVIRALGEGVLQALSRPFDTLDSPTGRPSMASAQLLRALRLQVLDTIRSERVRLEQRDDNRLLRGCVGLNMDDAVWAPTGFRKNRARWLAGEVAPAVFDQGLAQARERELLSDAHVTVDGTLIAAWAGQQGLKRREAEAYGNRTHPPGA